MTEGRLHASCQSRKPSSVKGIGTELTYPRDDLGLEAVLVLEPAGEIANPPSAVTGNVRHPPDVIEHMTTSEQ